MPQLPHLVSIAALERAFDANDAPRTAELVLSALRQGKGDVMRSFTAHPFEDDWRDFATKAVRDYLQAAQGHVYVVGNPLQRDFLKVGKTGRTPEKRLAELNNEAVVGAFMLVASWEVLDRHYVEKAAHRALSCFARVKEFFQGHYEPVCAAVAKAVEEDRAVLARAGFR